MPHSLLEEQPQLRTESAPKLPTMNGPRNELLSAFARLLKSGKYSDLTIVCGQREYAVHKALLCSRSRFFDGACSGRFHEASTGIIDLSEDDEEVVHHMIDYFYNLDYDFEPEDEVLEVQPSYMRTAQPQKQKRIIDFSMVEDPLVAQAVQSHKLAPLPTPAQSPEATLPEHHKSRRSPSPRSHKGKNLAVQSATPEHYSDDEDDVDMDEELVEPNLTLHAKMYAIAEKYEIQGLKELARHKFEMDCINSWDHEEFPDAILEAYENTVDEDRGLRGIVLQTFRSHPELARRQDVAAVVKDTPPLAYDLFRILRGMLV